ncbi:MAG: diguanylate cyclase [Proteobacteria bacterium]|nr:MAG: diguanylate cyclase [Pseudomonadota bacterium]
MSKVTTRILVVDDEAPIRTMVSQILVEEGYEVVQATSAERALEIFRDTHFPLVISDIRMGRMSGLELLDEVKRLRPETLVVIMSAYVSIDSAIAALKAGAYDYLIKPFENLELIVNVVRRAIENITLIKERNSLVEHLKKSNKALKELSRRFRDLAIRDGLTGLYNHGYLLDALAGEVARATRYDRPLSVIFLDVDHFKEYNDQFGHQGGDMVLKQISRILKDEIRKTDIAARYGGEEFVLVLPETSKENAFAVAEKIRKAVQKSIANDVADEGPTTITISAGVASYMDDGTDAHELIAKADEAVYAAKNDGRNAVRLAS